MKFDRHIGSTAAEVPVKFQSDRTILNTNLAASRLYEILRKDVFSDIETGPWSQTDFFFCYCANRPWGNRCHSQRASNAESMSMLWRHHVLVSSWDILPSIISKYWTHTPDTVTAVNSNFIMGFSELFGGPLGVRGPFRCWQITLILKSWTTGRTKSTVMCDPYLGDSIAYCNIHIYHGFTKCHQIRALHVESLFFFWIMTNIYYALFDATIIGKMVILQLHLWLFCRLFVT